MSDQKKLMNSILALISTIERVADSGMSVYNETSLLLNKIEQYADAKVRDALEEYGVTEDE